MPYLGNALIKCRSQIFTEVEYPRIELDPVDLDDGWLAGFIELLARIVRKIGGKE
jgi:hypothetical protein